MTAAPTPTRYQALILGGGDPGDPFAVSHGVAVKGLVPVAGQPMALHVLQAVQASSGRGSPSLLKSSETSSADPSVTQKKLTIVPMRPGTHVRLRFELLLQSRLPFPRLYLNMHLGSIHIHVAPSNETSSELSPFRPSRPSIDRIIERVDSILRGKIAGLEELTIQVVAG